MDGSQHELAQIRERRALARPLFGVRPALVRAHAALADAAIGTWSTSMEASSRARTLPLSFTVLRLMTLRLDPHRLIHVLLDAVGDDAAMGLALGAISEPLSSVAVQAFVVSKKTGLVVNNKLTFARDGQWEDFDGYEEHWRDVDPRYLTAIRRPGRAFSDVEVIEPATFERSALYNENLARGNVRYTLFGSFDVSPELAMAVAFMRPRSNGAYQQDEVDSFTRLVPTLTRALRVHELVRGLDEERRDLREALDTVPTAIAVVDARGRVRSTNAAACALLARGEGLKTERGVLTASHPATARHLAASIAEAGALARSSLARPAPSQSPVVKIERPEGPPLEVVLFPLHGQSSLRPSGHVMAVIHDPELSVSLDAELIARLYGLTATEAEVAVALAAGHSLSNVAAERGCSEQTVRTHLKRIFAKTGLSRQSDLVRALLTGAAIHATR